MPVGSSLSDVFGDSGAPLVDADGNPVAAPPPASFAPPAPTLASLASAPPAVQPTSQPAQSPDEVRQAQAAIMASPALSDQQKQTALAALPRVPPPSGLAAPAAAPGPTGVASLQGPEPLRGVPYSAGAAGGPTPGGAPPAAISQADLDALTRQHFAGAGAAHPAGYQPMSRTTEGVAYSPESMHAVGESLAANDELAQAQIGAASAQGHYQREADRRMAALDDVQRMADERRTEYVQQKMNDYHSHVEDLLSKAQQASEINPHQFWDEKSAPQKISMVLALMAHGFQWGLHGGESPADMLNKMIQQNIEGQKAKAASARQNATDAMTLYDFNRQHFGDEERTRLATELAQRQAIMRDIQTQVGDATAPAQGRLALAQVHAQLAKDQAATLRELDEKTAKQTTTEAYRQASTGAADPLAVLDYKGKLRDAAARATGTDLATRKGEAEIGKLETEANPAAKSKAQLDAYDNALDGLYEMRQMVAKGGTLSSAETAKGQALRNRLVNELARAQTGGTRAPSKEEQELIMAQLSKDPNAFQFTGSDAARLDETIKAVEAARRRAASPGASPLPPSGATPGFQPGVLGGSP